MQTHTTHTVFTLGNYGNAPCLPYRTFQKKKETKSNVADYCYGAEFYKSYKNLYGNIMKLFGARSSDHLNNTSRFAIAIEVFFLSCFNICPFLPSFVSGILFALQLLNKHDLMFH